MKDTIRPLSMMAVLVLFPVLAWHMPFIQQFLSHSRAWCQGPWAWLWFLPLAVVYSAAGLPRQALCIGAGAAFGVGVGFVLCSLAYVAGALIDYVVGRALGDRWSSGMVRPLIAFVRAAPFRGILSLRLLPISSSLVVSVASGGVRVPWLSFIGATALGGGPQTIIFVLMGSGLPMGHRQEVAGAAVLFALSVMLGMMMVRRYRIFLADDVRIMENGE